VASEYSVNISLDTKKAEAGLKRLRTQINDLNKPARTTKTTRQEEKISKLKEAQRVSMVQTRKIGDQVQRAADSGLKVDKARAAIRRASKADSAGLVKLADANRKSALSELKINQEITKEKAKQINLQRQMASPIGGLRTMMGSPTQLGFAGAGMGRSSLRGNRFQFGSPAFFEAGARAGGASSPLLGTRFDFGSPAQLAFSGGPSSPILGSKTTFGSPRFFDAAARAGGASSPIFGSKTTFGSPKFFEASAKAGGPSIPIKGSKDIFGSPAYYEAANKEALRIAKTNAMPIKGFKHLVGSPAYFEDQAKQFKKVSKEGGPSSALNFDRRTGKLLRGPAGSGSGGFRNLARRFDTQSALISGAFPLLFGQGPVGAAAGALGGGIGGMFGQMGGFAGGIAATAIVQQIQTALKAISELGQAMGPFTQNTESVTAAIGLQGSAEEARIRLIEQSEGKTAAFNASMQLMANRIGQDGVDSLKEFGDTTRLMNSEFTLAITKIQAFTAGIANFVLRITGLQENLNAAAATRTVADAAARGDVTAQNLVSRRETIEAMGSRGGEANRKAVLLEQLEIDEKIFAIMQNTTVEADVMTQKFDDLVNKIKEEEEETARILELRKEGLNPEIAKTIAGLEKEAKTSKESLDVEIEKLLEKQRQEGILGELDQTRLTTLERQKDAIDEAIDSTRDQVEATYDLNKAATETLDAFEQLNKTIQSDIKDGIKGLIKGTSTLGDMVSNIADRFLDLALNQALFGNAGGNIVTGGLFKFLGFANGGRPPVGVPSVVGEKGPELFVPDRSGTIIPNNQLGGSTTIVVNVDASGSNVEGDEQEGRELGKAISVAVQSELIKQKRPGGLLA
jgi:hypothetical protein|tara:strand:+ start:335 stop:2896 length:2562 start_codon:yes stop_codon:yes gene_type:complete